MRVADERQPVRSMSHEEPDGAEDRELRFFCGEEAQEYADNPADTDLYAASTTSEAP